MIKLKHLRVIFLSLYLFFYILYPKIYLFNYISLFLILGYYISDLKNNKNWRKIILVLSPIFLFYFIPSIYFNSFKNSITNIIDFFIRVSPITIGLNEMKHLSDKSNYKTYSTIRKIIIVLIFYISITNIIYLNSNPYFARIMANYNYDVPGLSGLGIASGGGYFTVYGFVFLLCYLFERIFLKKSKNILLNLLLMVFSIIFIIMANFATAFVMSIASILILLFNWNIDKKNFISLIVLVIAIVSIIHYKDIANYTVKKLPHDSIISIRINDAILKSNDSTAAERLELMKKSISTIKNNFIFGISSKNNHDYNLVSNNAGLHTEWIDFFARYGIVIAILYYYFIYNSFKKIINEELDRKLFITCFATTIILGFLNPVMNSGCYLFVFLVLPIMIKGAEYEKHL